MRRSAMFTLSTVHIPLDKRKKIETLIRAAPRGDDGRLHVTHDDLVIEPHLYGFFVHCGIAACQAADPPDISPQLWALLSAPMGTGRPGCCLTGMNLHPLAGRRSMQVEGALRLSSPAC